MYSSTLQGNKDMQFKSHYFKYKGILYKTVKDSDTDFTNSCGKCSLLKDCDNSLDVPKHCYCSDLHYIEVKNV